MNEWWTRRWDVIKVRSEAGYGRGKFIKHLKYNDWVEFVRLDNNDVPFPQHPDFETRQKEYWWQNRWAKIKTAKNPAEKEEWVVCKALVLSDPPFKSAKDECTNDKRAKESCYYDAQGRLIPPSSH